jgi:PAS domain S-box-containing protein
MNPLQSRSLRHKLNFIVVAATVLALGLSGVALVLFDLRNQSQSIRHDLAAQADIVGLASSAAFAFDDAKAATENLRALRANPAVAVAALYNERGQLFASYDAHPGDSEVPPVRAQPPGHHLDSEWMRLWRPVIVNRSVVGSVYVQARHNLGPRALEYLFVLGAILAAALLAALLLAERLQRGVTRPLVALGDVAQGIMRGNFSLRARKTSHDEVGALVDAFNAMVDELDRRARTLEQANAALRASEERYQLGIRGSSAGMWDWDLRERTMFYSPRLKSMLGYSEAEFPDKPESMLLVVHPDDVAAVRAALRDHLMRDKPYHVEVRVRLRSGEERWFAIAGTALRDEHGRPFRMAGSVVDVHERKQAETVLREANRAKDEFIATLAHELRNPLAPIRTALEILKLDRGNGPASQRARETMERQLAHMIRLIDDLLDISRITSGKIRLEKKRVALAGALESAVETSRPAIEAGRHALDVQLPAETIELEADATRLAQSVANLLNNAAKYTPPGGHIVLRAWREGGCAVIEVRDNGVGIAPEMLEQVFTMFAQVNRTLDRAQGGLGIGLSLVRSLVGLHGGSVEAASDGPGRGSTFTIRLPCLPAAAPAAAEGRAEAGSAPAARGLKVLVVDDNVDAATTLAAMLDMLDYRTRTVHSGLDVLAAAHAFEPDVVLLDIGLPGMSGYEVARQLRADPKVAQTWIIAVTGWGAEADRQRGREAGFDHHLTKPVNVEELLALLRGVAPQSAFSAA